MNANSDSALFGTLFLQTTNLALQINAHRLDCRRAPEQSPFISLSVLRIHHDSELGDPGSSGRFSAIEKPNGLRAKANPRAGRLDSVLPQSLERLEDEQEVHRVRQNRHQTLQNAGTDDNGRPSYVCRTKTI